MEVRFQNYTDFASDFHLIFGAIDMIHDRNRGGPLSQKNKYGMQYYSLALQIFKARD